MSSDSNSRTNELGTLVIDVPHWTAVVQVSDNLSQPVAGIGSAIDAGDGRFNVTASLKPGVYNVKVGLGTSSDSEWVSVRPGKVTTVPVSRWSELRLASAAPRQTSSDGLGQHVGAAEEWSRLATWGAPSGHSRLFIFVRTMDVAKYPNFANGLSLHDASNKLLTSLDAASTRKDADAGWMTFAAHIPPGSYILRRDGPPPWLYSQPLYVCDSWETHVFIVGGKGPSFRALTVHMAPFGTGFRHDDETAAASDAVLLALMRGDPMRSVVCSKQLNQLLRREQKNPWLAVLAVHGMLAVEEEWRREGVDPRTVIDFDPTLKHDVIGFLNTAIGTHPDVRALSLKDDVPASQPFDFPPMLRAGLQRVQQHATKFADTIPVGSLTDRMLDRLLTSSAWSVWRQSVEASTRQADAMRSEKRKPQGKKDSGQRRLATAILRSALNPSAPIFVAPRPTGTPPPGASDVGRVIYDVPLIKAAQSMIGVRGTPLADKIVVDEHAEAIKLFEQVDPRAFSAAAGIPLGRAERAVNKLRRLTKAGTSLLANTGPTAQAVVEFALREASRNLRPGGAPTEQASGVLKPEPEKRRITFEEAAGTLRATAVQLKSVDPSQTNATEIARAARIAERLQAIALTLLGHADLIAITGPDGQFVYANGAFTILLSLVDPDQPVRAGRRWCKWLSTLPVGRSTNLRSPVDPANRHWTVRRVAVEYTGKATTSAYVNILDDEATADVLGDVFDRIAVVSEVSLHASFVEYGSPRRRTESLEALEQIATGLEHGLATVQRASQERARADD